MFCKQKQHTTGMCCGKEDYLEIFGTAAVIAVASAAVACDYISYRIPNRLMLYAAVSIAAGMAVECIWIENSGVRMLPDIPLRMLMMLVILIPAYMVHAVGAGDIKLMCVIAAVTGVRRAGVIFIVALLIAALYGIPVLIRRGCGMHKIHFSYAILAALVISILSTQIIL